MLQTNTKLPTDRTFDADWLRLPPGSPGQKIGLFGGSFNPPHSGHRHVALTALKRLSLDAVWWLVTPGNPLKTHTDLAPLGARVAICAAIANHPRMRITAYEARIGTAYSAETIADITTRRQGVDFVWIMGADNLKNFHNWQHWQQIVDSMPIAIVDRPGSSLSASATRVAQRFSSSRIREEDAKSLAGIKAPAWVFLHAPHDESSSTDLRQRRQSTTI